MRKIHLLVVQLGGAVLLLAALFGLTRVTTLAQAEPTLSPRVLAAQAPTFGQTTGTSLVTDNVIIVWDKLALDAIRLAKPGPPVVARALAMVHTAMYEAWSQYDVTATGVLLGG